MASSNTVGTSPITSELRKVAALRHHHLCTAVPFPQLNWDRVELVEENLHQLHGYALDFVHSAIDWYTRRSHWSRFWSRFFRGASYLCALIGALLPLIMIFGPYLVTG